MYLTARISAYRTYGEDEASPLRVALEAAAAAVGFPPSDNIDTISLSRECAYWRKANQIHGWFVREVQKGEDDCGEYYVERQQLGKLSELCAELLKKSDPIEAAAKLPPVPGFFFGSSDVDGWFWSDLGNTVIQIDRALLLPTAAKFYYRSSW